MLRLMSTLLCFLGIFLVPAFAHAQERCRERSNIVELLETRYGEKHRAFGTTPEGTLIELFVSPSGTWTLLLSFPNGSSCLIEAGTDWTETPEEKPKRIS